MAFSNPFGSPFKARDPFAKVYDPSAPAGSFDFTGPNQPAGGPRPTVAPYGGGPDAPSPYKALAPIDIAPEDKGVELPFMEPFELSPELATVRQRLSNTYGEWMDPDYSMFSPEDRAAADRRIGSMLAINERGIGADMARRGLTNSGVNDQLRSDANVAAAVGMGDVMSRFSEVDALARERAAGNMYGMLSSAEQQEYDRYLREADVYTDYANAIGPGIAAGPETELTNFIDWYGVKENKDRFDQAFDLAWEEGKIGPQDLIGIWLGEGGVGDKAFASLIAIVGGFMSNNQQSPFGGG